MNSSKNSIRIFSSLLIGVAVSLIMFGSLINFHQYKIWGKPLVCEFIGYKRDHDKSYKITPVNKFSFSGKQLHTLDALFLNSELQNNSFPRASASLNLSTEFIFLFTGIVPSQHGLRAPPAV